MRSAAFWFLRMEVMSFAKLKASCLVRNGFHWVAMTKMENTSVEGVQPDECTGEGESFADFFYEAHGHSSSEEVDKECVEALRKLRAASEAKRSQDGFDDKFETWWKRKYGSTEQCLLWKETMRGMAKFK